MILGTLFALAALSSSSCGQPIEDPKIAQAKEAVGRELKDPGSAQYRDIEVYDGVVCGQVNAKNSYGGYVGFQPFLTVRSTAAIGGDESTVESIRLAGAIRRACMTASIGQEFRDSDKYEGASLEEELATVWERRIESGAAAY